MGLTRRDVLRFSARRAPGLRSHLSGSSCYLGPRPRLAPGENRPNSSRSVAFRRVRRVRRVCLAQPEPRHGVQLGLEHADLFGLTRIKTTPDGAGRRSTSPPTPLPVTRSGQAPTSVVSPVRVRARGRSSLPIQAPLFRRLGHFFLPSRNESSGTVERGPSTRRLEAARSRHENASPLSMETVMRKSVVSLVSLVSLFAVSAFACGGAPDAPPPLRGSDGGFAPSPSASGSSSPQNPEAGPVLPGNDPRSDAGPAPVPPPPPTKPNEITEAFGVFVSTTGQANASGTRTAPLSTIEAAIERAKSENKKKVFVCEGSYAEALTLADGVSIEGRLDCATPDWKLDETKHVDLTAPSSPAIRATSITSATRIDGVYVTAPDATETSGSSIAVLAIDSNGLTFAQGRITAGNAMKGDDGQERQALIPVARLAEAGLPEEYSPPPHTSGRAGGAGARFECYLDYFTTLVVTEGGTGGSSGLYTRDSIFSPWAVFAGPGRGGAAKGSPAPGPQVTVVGTAGTTLVGHFEASGYVPGDGQPGTSGGPGVGGAGGDGIEPNRNGGGVGYWFGTSGAGGGAGGCPGLAGTAGKGGGASVGILSIRSAVQLDKMTVGSAQGGAAGRGTFGSAPSPGTIGAGSAAPGAYGGEAGISPNGSAGPSYAIAHEGGAPVLQQSTTTAGPGGAGVEERTTRAMTIPAAPVGEAVAVKAL